MNNLFCGILRISICNFIKTNEEKAEVEYANSPFSTSMNTFSNIYKLYLGLAFVQSGQNRVCYHVF